MIEPHGHWLTVIAERPADWRVSLTGADGVRRALAARPEMRGAVSVLFVTSDGPVRVVELEDAAGRPIGGVALAQ